MIRSFSKINKVSGELKLPGDKSISHRAVIFSSMAKGESIIHNLSSGEDVKSTISCLSSLGVSILNNNNLTAVTGSGFKGFWKPDRDIYAGNSGTTARLLSGLLAVQNFPSLLTGDESLSRRPMMRVIEPLSLMGADLKSPTGNLPLQIDPVKFLKPLDYKLLIPSAQVKGAVILAGLHIEDPSFITEYFVTRDHTERMLGLSATREEGKNVIRFSQKNYPEPAEYYVPSDISSSVYFIILTLVTPGSELVVRNVSINPTRTGIIDILKKMGADITIQNEQVFANEPFGDLVVRSSQLKNVEIPADVIPNIIDEIPVLTIAGLFAEGEFSISGAGELRYKETDRIDSICTNLRKNGFVVEEYVDGFAVKEKVKDSGMYFESFGDHRIAMAFSILSMLSPKGGTVNDFECISISNPSFIENLNSITA